MIKVPSLNVFQKLFNKMLPMYDPLLDDPESIDLKELPQIIKALGYPYYLKENIFDNVGAPTCWQHAISILHWLSQVIQEMSDNKIDYTFAQEAENLLRDNFEQEIETFCLQNYDKVDPYEISAKLSNEVPSLGSMPERLETVKSELRNKKNFIETLKVSTQELQAEVDDHQKMLNERERLTAEIRLIKAEIASGSKEEERRKHNLNKLISECDELSATILVLQEKSESIEKKIQGQPLTLTEAEILIEQIARNQSNISTTAKEIGLIEGELIGKSSQLADLDLKIDSGKQEISQLEDQAFETLDFSLEDDIFITALRSIKEIISEDIQQGEELKNELRNSLAILKSESERLNQEIIDGRAKVSTLNFTFSSLQKNLENLANSKEKVSKNIEINLSLRNATEDELTQKIVELEENKITLLGEIEISKTNIEEANKRIDDLVDRVSSSISGIHSNFNEELQNSEKEFVQILEAFVKNKQKIETYILG